MASRVLLVSLLISIISGAEYAGRAAGKEPQEADLCSLQATIGGGHHVSVRVSGVFRVGLELGTLEDPECPSRTTWVELHLASQENRDKLRAELDRSRSAFILVEGEFYGPPLPDPKLPEPIRKALHPGWGHLGMFRTKLEVHAILDVKPVEGGPR